MRNIVLLTVSLLACGPVTPKPKPTPGGADCASVCAHVGPAPDGMGCEVGKPTPNGATCIQVCEASHANGTDWPLDCMLAATSCNAAQACGF